MNGVIAAFALRFRFRFRLGAAPGAAGAGNVGFEVRFDMDWGARRRNHVCEHLF